MFGYIKPYNQELRVKDVRRYSACYCALCDQLKRDYGFFGRFILNYDVTFLLICLDYLSSEEKGVRKIRCPYNPLRVKIARLSPESLEYAAFINYWLVVEKLKDDIADDKNFLKKILHKFLVSRRTFKRHLVKYQLQSEQLSDMLHEVYQQEKNASSVADFDCVTNAFGKFFANLFLGGIEKTEDTSLGGIRDIFFQVGKWIYIMDAFDDLKSDIKKGHFNLLFSLEDGKAITKEVAFEKTISLHLLIKRKIKDYLSKEAEIKDECIANIITDGIDVMFCRIVVKKYSEYKERLKEYGYNLEGMDSARRVQQQRRSC